MKTVLKTARVAFRDRKTNLRDFKTEIAEDPNQTSLKKKIGVRFSLTKVTANEATKLSLVKTAPSEASPLTLRSYSEASRN